ncbi:MAG: hypothetical protein ACK4NF_07315, partial [Planctomycetota bacterium]
MNRYVWKIIVSVTFIFAMIVIFYGVNDKDKEEGTGIVKPKNPTKIIRKGVSQKGQKQQSAPAGKQGSQISLPGGGQLNPDDYEIEPEGGGQPAHPVTKA